MRCTEATLRAFGITDKCPKTGLGVLQAIQESGRTFSVIDLPRNRNTTVRRFVKERPEGSFYLVVNAHALADHAMALVDGQLTDTTGRGVDGRWVQLACKVN